MAMTDVEKLKEAARLVSEVRDGLDASETTCAVCAHRRYGNWGHKNARDALKGALGRIERSVGALQEEERDAD